MDDQTTAKVVRRISVLGMTRSEYVRKLIREDIATAKPSKKKGAVKP